MKDKVYEMFQSLSANTGNYVVYYEKGKRIVKTFAALSADIDACIGRLASLDPAGKTIALCGPVSYYWMVIDLACIKGGYYSIAIPETFDDAEFARSVSEADILLLDYSMRHRRHDFRECYLFNCGEDGAVRRFDDVPVSAGIPRENLVREQYGIAFTSGTSGVSKKIKLFFPQPATGGNKKQGVLKRLKTLYRYKSGFWSRKDNRLIIFMPFSHLQQRTFALFALMRKINIILSNPADCIRHIVIEKPNIMISVPVFYEVLARRIEEKLERLPAGSRYAMAVFNFLGIHSWSNRNLLKKIWSSLLFRDIRRIYGGRADYFITGSAPIRREVLHTFYRIGVKVFEAYGQSEATVIAMNTEKHFRIGSVGKPGPNIRVSEEGEILLKYNEAKHGYNRDVLQVKDGYIHTGDAGYIDDDGFLFLLGRIDDVIVLGNGKKIFPENIEQKFRRYEAIKQAVVFCNRHQKLSLVIEPAKKPRSASFEEIIREVNNGLPAYERITEYIESTEPFTAENGLLTASFKIKRKQVIHNYASQTFIPVP